MPKKGTCHRIRELWSSTFKERAADPCCTRVAPKPLKGRWGVAFECSKFLLEAGRDQTLAIIKMVLVPGKKKRGDGKAGSFAKRASRKKKQPKKPLTAQDLKTIGSVLLCVLFPLGAGPGTSLGRRWC